MNINSTKISKNSHYNTNNDWEMSGFLSPDARFEKKARLVKLEEELIAKD